MTSPSGFRSTRLRVQCFLAATISLFVAALACGAEDRTIHFNVPAGAADRTLKQFSAQSDVQLAYPTDLVKGVRTNAIQGSYQPFNALERMLAGTPLKVVRDEKPGAFAIRHIEDPNGSRATPESSDRPGQSAAMPKRVEPVTSSDRNELIELSPFEVVADATDTYDATNTNSVTGTNLSLEKTPLNAKIFNRTLMDELAVVDVAEMLSTFGGLGPTLLGSGEDQSGMLEGDAVDYKSMMSRGLKISNPRRDGFLRSDTSLMDSYDVESAEALQGSNSLLFGSGDAGGVININSKRARLNQRFARATAMWDSEGSERYTTDINIGTQKVAIRVNAVKGDLRYFRPVLRLRQEGLQVAPIVRPFKWLTISGEYRHYIRDQIRSQNPVQTVRAPTNLLLTNGVRLDNQQARLITGLGGSELLDNYIHIGNHDALAGAYKRHYYNIEGKAIAVEARASKDLYFQFRFGEDDRTNDNVTPSSSVIYHPDAAGNNYVDANGNRIREWAMNTGVNMSLSGLGARGYKFTGVYHRDLERLGDHWFNAFFARQDTTNDNSLPYRFYETDANGVIIQNPALIANAQSGRILMPGAWGQPFPEKIFNHYSWPAPTLVHPTNGKTYQLAPLNVEGAVPPTSGNPLGLSGPIDAATGEPTAAHNRFKTREQSFGISVASEFWGGRINTMAGFRFDEADRYTYKTGTMEGPINYDSTTLGTVFNTPIKGVRGYASYATNANQGFGGETNVFNEVLPIGKGVSKEVGLKLSLWDHRVSGNISYYISEAQNFTASLGQYRDVVDPSGINGRNGGGHYLYSITSDGIDLRLSLRPIRPWQITANFSQANGSERNTVVLPVLYNDEFNTTSVNGQTVVAVRSTTGAVTPLMVPSAPSNPGGAQMPLSIAMMRDASSPYFAVLDPDSGQILNPDFGLGTTMPNVGADNLGLNAPGVGTNRTGLPIADHQLGFVPPSSTVIVRQAGARTTGYAENSFSIINRYQFPEGRLRGLVLGLSSIYNLSHRAYMYTDAAGGGERKTFYYPDRFENRFFAVYRLRPIGKVRATVQLNVSNLFDRQAVVALPGSTNGLVRAFTYQYAPRKVAITTTIGF